LKLPAVVQRVKQALFSASGNLGGWLYGNGDRSPLSWQRGIRGASHESILAFSAVYTCVSLIADDISKLCIGLMMLDPDGIEIPVASNAFTPVLRKPNRYQNRIQFLSQWIVSKLLYGNAYILKERDSRGVVVAMYVLNPARVAPLVAPDGSVYYRVGHDFLTGVDEGAEPLPASEIIHDRMLCLWHPLVGVSPIYACASSATQGIRIQANSARFFANMSSPSGMLTAPGRISPEQADELKERFERHSSGENVGRLLVAGMGLEFKPLMMPARDAQLVAQLEWTVADVARCFKVPGHKLGLTEATLNSLGALNQDYLSQTLQTLISSVELCLDEGLGLTLPPVTPYFVKLDLDDLQRMDPLAVAETEKALSGIKAVNESRKRLNLPPVPGGDAVYLQQQYFSTEALAKRDTLPDPFASTITPDLTQLPKPGPGEEPAPAAPAAANDDYAEAAKAAVAAIEHAAQLFAGVQAESAHAQYLSAAKAMEALAALDARIERAESLLEARSAELLAIAVPAPRAGDEGVDSAKDLAYALIAKFANEAQHVDAV
jgi:HK97 family phage portal protein